MYYLGMDTLRSGDNLIKTDSNQRYTVSRTDSLIGVYNINKGYADFRQISILYQNDEYSIVRSNTTYGLNVYDYIVLDSATVDKNITDNAAGSTSEQIEEQPEEQKDDVSSEENSDENPEDSPEDTSEDVTEGETESSTEEISDTEVINEEKPEDG